jgi:hypothetical protein
MAARGEGIIVGEGREVNVLFTNRTIGRAESQIGKSIKIIISNGLQELGMSELAIFLRVGMQEAADKNISLDDAYDVIDMAGFLSVNNVITKCLMSVLSFSQNGDDPN